MSAGLFSIREYCKDSIEAEQSYQRRPEITDEDFALSAGAEAVFTVILALPDLETIGAHMRRLGERLKAADHVARPIETAIIQGQLEAYSAISLLLELGE